MQKRLLYNNPVALRVPLSSLKMDSPNAFEVDGKFPVVVLYDGRAVKVVEESCPHMGGPLSRGALCAKDRTLACPWHGYEFSTQDLAVARNPNEDMWIRQLAAEDFDTYKTPKYRLKEVPFELADGVLTIRPPRP